MTREKREKLRLLEEDMRIKRDLEEKYRLAEMEKEFRLAEIERERRLRQVCTIRQRSLC